MTRRTSGGNRSALPDIEVTPEMIEAGVGALLLFSVDDWKAGWVSSSEIARAVFGAMALTAATRA